MMSTSLQRIILFVLILVFFSLVFSVYSQYRIARENLDANLEESLRFEGEALAEWISRSFFGGLRFEVWEDSPNPELLELTGSRWALVDEEGDLVTDANGIPFYEYPEGALADMKREMEISRDRLKSVLQLNSTVLSDLERVGDHFVKRVYVPIRLESELLSQDWVLVGQAGEGYFADLFDRQKKFWWTASILSLASVVFIVLLFRGISRTERIERRLRDAEEEIQLESLTSTLAHELRNPLSIIQSTAEILLRDEPLSPDGRELANDIVEEVRRSQDVLSRHLHPERREADRIEDLVSFLEDYWKRRAALAETRNLEVNTSYPDRTDPLAVRAVPSQLEQILDNLLRNSSEAMPDGGEIRMELRVESEKATLVFGDNGPGLGRFGAVWRDGWRMESSKAEGRGIGLRLARRWVQEWGGEFEAKTRRSGWLGKTRGTEIRIALRRSE